MFVRNLARKVIHEIPTWCKVFGMISGLGLVGVDALSASSTSVFGMVSLCSHCAVRVFLSYIITLTLMVDQWIGY